MQSDYFVMAAELRIGAAVVGSCVTSGERTGEMKWDLLPYSARPSRPSRLSIKKFDQTNSTVVCFVV